MCAECGYTICHASCPNRPRNIIGVCGHCGDEIEEDYTYFKDGEGNIFCSEECAIDYYEIKEVCE